MGPVAVLRAVAFFVRQNGDSYRKREIKSCRNYIYLWRRLSFHFIMAIQNGGAEQNYIQFKVYTPPIHC